MCCLTPVLLAMGQDFSPHIAKADEKLRCFNLELVTEGMVPEQQMLADGIHYYYLLHSFH